MRPSLPYIVLTASFVAFSAGQAEAQILICSDQPNGPSGFQIDLNPGGSQVRFQGNWLAASFTDREIRWSIPRYEDRGEVRFGANYNLNRIDGTLRVSNQCLSRDSICNPGYVSYCRVGKPIF
jgi:hypothetical protein